MKSFKPIAFVQTKELLFKKLLFLCGCIAIVILLCLLFTLVSESFLSINHFGFQFLTSYIWDPVRSQFGALPFFIGTLMTSILALLISLPFSFALALFLGEYFQKGKMASFLRSVLDLLSGIPSVIYGFWGLFVLVPIVRQLQLLLGVPALGVGVLTAALILALMIIPYSASISREVIALVPQELKEAALSLGATRFEMVRSIIIPYAKSGMFAGILMSFGRAISETMAVTMLIGNSNKIPTSIFSAANTMSSVIANEFAEATQALYLSSLVELALILFIITAIFGLIGRIVIKKWVVA